MIILKISAEYLAQIRRNYSSNVRLKTPKLGVQNKFRSTNPRNLVFYRLTFI